MQFLKHLVVNYKMRFNSSQLIYLKNCCNYQILRFLFFNVYEINCYRNVNLSKIQNTNYILLNKQNTYFMTQIKIINEKKNYKTSKK